MVSTQKDFGNSPHSNITILQFLQKFLLTNPEIMVNLTLEETEQSSF